MAALQRIIKKARHEFLYYSGCFLNDFIYSMFSKRPLGGLWVFFLIIFLATWAGQLWIIPFGPVGWGIRWMPLFLTSVFFSFLIFALMPPVSDTVTTKEEKQANEGAEIVVGIFLDHTHFINSIDNYRLYIGLHI